jgi:ankyrin repeat protein
MNPDGMTPLHIAVAYGLLDVARCLIDCRADVNARDKMGNPPLHY